jgi:hypothetical protein
VRPKPFVGSLVGTGSGFTVPVGVLGDLLVVKIEHPAGVVDAFGQGVFLFASAFEIGNGFAVQFADEGMGKNVQGLMNGR